MLVLVLVVFLFKRSGPPPGPPTDLAAYEPDAWGDALRPGETIAAQVPVIEPPGVLDTLLSSNIGRGHPTPYQLALTSQGALLVARRAADRLRERDRYPMGEVAIAREKADGEHYVSVDLRLGEKKQSFVRVPRPFFDRLRALPGAAAQ